MTPLGQWLRGHSETRMTARRRATHTYVIGQPGTGKSRALESWVMQDILAGRGATVIDPHGDLFHHLLAYTAMRPELWNRVVIFDPCDPKWTVSFNPLEMAHGVSTERLALFLTDVVVKIWKLDPAGSPRLVWLLTNSFLALSELRLTLLDLPRFLLDARWRDQFLPRLSHEGVRSYFAYEFPKSPGAVQQWVTPVLNKIGGLIFDRDIRLMLAGDSTIRFRSILDQKLILLAHVPKGVIGEGASALLGAFLVAHLQKAALSRADTSVRVPYYLYLDEFQNYTTDNIKDILSESRKYGLSLILAHQYLDQLSSGLRSAVLNTTGTLVCFRIGYHDAAQLAKEIFPSPDFLAIPKQAVRLRRFVGVPLITIEQHEESLRWEGLTQLLASLQPREFWAKQRGRSQPVKVRTLTMPDPILTPELEERIVQLRDVAGTRYGRLKREAQREVGHQQSTSASQPQSGSPHSQSRGRGKPEDIPWWGS